MTVPIARYPKTLIRPGPCRNGGTGEGICRSYVLRPIRSHRWLERGIRLFRPGCLHRGAWLALYNQPRISVHVARLCVLPKAVTGRLLRLLLACGRLLSNLTLPGA
jgi:hypothetical protein